MMNDGDLIIKNGYAQKTDLGYDMLLNISSWNYDIEKHKVLVIRAIVNTPI